MPTWYGRPSISTRWPRPVCWRYPRSCTPMNRATTPYWSEQLWVSNKLFIAFKMLIDIIHVDVGYSEANQSPPLRYQRQLACFFSLTYEFELKICIAYPLLLTLLQTRWHNWFENFVKIEKNRARRGTTNISCHFSSLRFKEIAKKKKRGIE